MYIMRSNNKSIYPRIRAVFLCFKQSSYIRITILILSTYFYLFFLLFLIISISFLCFYLIILNTKNQKFSCFTNTCLLLFTYFNIFKNINIFICIESAFLKKKKKKYSKLKFAVFLLLLI